MHFGLRKMTQRKTPLFWLQNEAICSCINRYVRCRGIILEPLCGKCSDRRPASLLTEKNGALVGLDCSWAHIERFCRFGHEKDPSQTSYVTTPACSEPRELGEAGEINHR